ncbi:hypothetical protein I6G65_15865 [Sphingomonas paucimobilis]|uniref:DNA, contig: SP630 n=1 Tax=Sphingomonas paucimobilis NBRC 13935 TaxID=1219050 RepID=A0A0C9NHJ0_SPHPI|nr:hypothetical protein [Sphingomonas paucimobilis]QPS15770.1 hypothetical protein I6G65_15865 [Sphingomonas paucimobilis]GAN14163.1 hypothetical protein SP6_30_03040 [Sphingomonas paucimobilis NBRC 13935]SUJ08015.1 Uncharacterised protein [Sphingomonas paucimobilis]
MDLATIIKAIEIVGAATPAAIRLYEGFKVLVSEADQAELQAVLDRAMDQSDRLHDQVQAAAR